MDLILALLGYSTVELGGRSGNLAWHAPTNDYRKTKFSCRKTRIAGISQSKFVPTVANDLRRKLRGWMRAEIGFRSGMYDHAGWGSFRGQRADPGQTAHCCGPR